MLNTWVFMLFVIATFTLYWVLVPPRGRAWFLALVSMVYFYAYYPRETLFLLFLSLLVYGIGRAMVSLQDRQRFLMTLAVVMLVGGLAYFKYAAFLLGMFNVVLKPLINQPLAIPRIFIPIGISYFTFKMIHYIVDTAKGTIPRHKLGDFLSYIFFYPILVSGPIERFQPFFKQLNSNFNFQLEYLNEGLPRILVGLFKKFVLADTLALTAVLLQQPDLSAGQYWLASFAYTFQLFFDFSGYTDMAIGISRLFGLKIIENFDQPYLAADISTFWKKWHMSLTGWFRDYLFIPLGGSRGSLGFIIRNTFIVMAITGLWHGAGWHFVVWGLYHAGGLTILRLYRKYLLPGLKAKSVFFTSWPSQVVGTILTFNFVNIGWILFACNFQQSIYVIKHLFS